MEILTGTLGLIFGFLVTWLFLRFSQKSEKEKLIRLQERMDLLNEQLIQVEKDYRDEQERSERRYSDLIKSNEQLKHAELKLKEQDEYIHSIQDRFQESFESIAHKVLHQSIDAVANQNKVSLVQTLKPLQEQIKHFESRINENVKEQNSLKGALETMVAVHEKMSNETANLTKALKGENKRLGAWGEMILEKLLEESGLVKNREYVLEEVHKNANGDQIRPDVIVYLPESKHVIIDSKVSLTAYESLINDQEGSASYEQQLVQSVKAHIKGLGDKNYQSAQRLTTPEFVLLFMPVEGAFSMALQLDPSLFNYAWDKGIVMVSPTTLLATLRTIAVMWKQEQQNRNALKIAREGGKLYDKFVGFVADMKTIKVHLDKSAQAYDSAFSKLSDGNGNLIKRADDLKNLGAKTSKNLDP